MSIREEFENAFNDWYIQTGNDRYVDPLESALWAAKWMAERCADIVDDYYIEGAITGDTIIKLAKELE